MKSREYLERIREIPALSRAVLKKIVLDGERATFHLVTDQTYHEEDVAAARAVTQDFVPEGCTGDVRVVKSVPSEEGVRARIAEVLKNNYPAAAAFVSPADISVELDGAGGRFVIGVAESERTQFVRGNVLDGVAEDLARSFPGAWAGDCRSVEKVMEAPPEEPLPPPEVIIAPRVFSIENYAPIDGASPKFAVYMADLVAGQTDVTVCGTISFLEERMTKKEKPFFSFTVSDGTAQLRLSYFSKKATLEKVRALKVGDSVCFTGDMELFNGSPSFRAKAVDLGTLPKDFVPEALPSRPAPPRYTAVFPEPCEDLVQGMLFGETRLPAGFEKGRYVVFDLETTGLNNNPVAGPMDRIIEVGAVKIEGGKIAEKFSTFVACPVKLTDEIVGITGIEDEMLIGAPPVETVMADFYKFTEGCALVGHNVQFDYKFIRYYGEQEGYLFDAKTFDTVALSQQLLRLKNYKLNTVADYFGFTFRHHRAFDDAFVTAKIFLELVKLGGIPK